MVMRTLFSSCLRQELGLRKTYTALVVMVSIGRPVWTLDILTLLWAYISTLMTVITVLINVAVVSLSVPFAPAPNNLKLPTPVNN